MENILIMNLQNKKCINSFSSSDGGFGGSIRIPLISDPAGEISAQVTGVSREKRKYRSL